MDATVAAEGRLPRLTPGKSDLQQSTEASSRAGAQAFGLLVLAFLLFALAAGGASTGLFYGRLVEVCAVPVLAVAAWRLIHLPRSPRCWAPLALVFAAFGLALAQLAPMPPDLWMRLPGRQAAAAAYDAAGMARPWLPLSLTPDATWAAAAGLLPPAAMLAAVLTLNEAWRRRLAVAALVAAVASVVLGALQLAGGEASPLRIYELTDTGAAVGFFANRNHQGVFLAAALPLAALVATARAREGLVPPWVWTVLGFAVAAVLIVGVAAAKSRAGVLLAAPGVLGAIVVALHGRAGVARGRWGWVPAASLGAAALLGAALVLVFNAGALADRFEIGPTQDLRYRLTPVVVDAGARFSPVGSGLGSFPVVYGMFERPEMLSEVFVNHAHNDYAEIWLEAGWPGLVLVLAFVAWWAATTRNILRAPGYPAAALAFGASAVVALLLVHSSVDYPLRTPALATFFALACGLMTPPPRPSGASLR